ncbi:hypothetical protein [Microcystis aeruginosa]|nr:hypothetical protein [Microcystis aeruginosa]ARI79741.1 hypothetical protein BH695_0460 [Microcystis aeruginosa PCC 7806SL]ELS45461.1 hypothetical protein C789_4749 [Microcystis aeruginosa FACHB-905 = DIANCHI905]WKX63085.1 hypothetical protein Q3H53_003162 [Microcystis aeruginosa PCC 7806]
MMKFSYQIPVALIGAVVCLVQPQLAIALTLQEIQVIAEEITVKIDGAGTGSGVIFDRQGNKYFVLTCRPRAFIPHSAPSTVTDQKSH